MSPTHETPPFVQTLHQTHYSVANALRRVLLSWVPTMAMELIHIEENTSPLHDEFLAHRLGLVPIVSSDVVHRFRTIAEWGDAASDLDVNHPNPDPEPDLDEDSIAFTLDVANTEDGVREVTSNDLTLDPAFPNVRPVGYSSDGSTPGIILMRLAKGQRIRLTASLAKGVGKDHAKFQPVATAVFQYRPVVRLNQGLLSALSRAEKEAVANAEPSGALAYDEEREELVVVDQGKSHTFNGESVKKAAELGVPGLVDVQMKQDEFIFRVEPVGQHSARMCVLLMLRETRKNFMNLRLHTQAAVRDAEMAYA